MMRLWMMSYSRRSPARAAAGVSVSAHVLLIAAWVVATLPPATLALESLANHLYYIPPPNRPPAALGPRETVHYIALTKGTGAGPAAADPTRAASLAAPSTSAGAPVVDSAAPPAPAATPEPRGDSVYTVLEVDSAVMRSENSAGPAYPIDLLQQHIEGSVIVRYVVDTTGFADTSSLVIVSATNPGFAQSVRDALPYMRFSPAKIGSMKVRQLVQQPFAFRIAASLASEKPKP